MKIKDVQISIQGFHSLTQSDIQFLENSLRDMLELNILTLATPDRNFCYLGEQCCQMTWLVDNEFVVTVDFNNCIEQEW